MDIPMTLLIMKVLLYRFHHLSHTFHNTPLVKFHSHNIMLGNGVVTEQGSRKNQEK